MNEDEALNKFINDILSDKDLSGVTEEAKTFLVEDLKTRLLDQINRALIEALPEDKLGEFNTMLDNESVNDEQVQQYITNSGVDIKKVVAKTMLLFRDLYLQTPEQRDQTNIASEV